MADVSLISPEQIFDADDTPNVDFEIALTALLATITLGTVPVSQHPHTLRFFAYLLLFMTLVRRIAISNNLTDNTTVFEVTRIFVLSLSYILIFAQVFTLTYEVSGSANSIFHLLLIMISVIMIFVAWVILQEQLFGDLAIYLAILANNGAVTAQNSIFSPLSEYLIDMAGRFVYMSSADNIPDVLAELRPDSLERPRNRKYMVVFLILSFGIFYGLSWVLLAVASGTAVKAAVFFIAAILIQYPVDFLYSRYGAVGFYTERSVASQHLPVAFGVVATLILL